MLCNLPWDKSLHQTQGGSLAIPGWVLLSHSSRMRDDPADGLSLWDKVGVPVSQAVESRVRLPFGLNVLCVAHRD